ncbi:MAG: transcription antitermination factor NusB [Deltaproteobacteria bacterium]|nr:transcription antitermination factor NusB [Deltaproteobacteria bacterium]
MAIQMLYQSDVGGSDLRQIFASFDFTPYLTGPSKAPEDAETEAAPEEKPRPVLQRPQLEEAFTYACNLVRGAVENTSAIDKLITEQADNWRLERMPIVDRNVLRLAVYEMLYEQDIPKLVVVDEAIELAKRFGSENSSRFVNGLLDGLLKQAPFHGRAS